MGFVFTYSVHNNILQFFTEPPLQPNGIITEYQVYQRVPVQCPYDSTESICTYTECPIDQNQCGSQCYRESEQVRNQCEDYSNDNTIVYSQGLL